MLAVSKVIVTLPCSPRTSMTRSVDIEDLSPVTCHTPVTIPRTVVRAAVAGGRPLITQNGAATVTLLIIGETLRAAFEIVVPVVTIILIDHRAVTRLGGGCHRGD